MNPVARTEKIDIHGDSEGGFAVTDTTTGVLMDLHPVTAAVWRSADGTRSVADIVNVVEAELGTSVSSRVVWASLDVLADQNLLLTRPAPPAGSTNANPTGELHDNAIVRRRSLLSRVGVVTGAAVATGLLRPAAALAKEKGDSNSGGGLPAHRQEEQEHKAGVNSDVDGLTSQERDAKGDLEGLRRQEQTAKADLVNLSDREQATKRDLADFRNEAAQEVLRKEAGDSEQAQKITAGDATHAEFAQLQEQRRLELEAQEQEHKAADSREEASKASEDQEQSQKIADGDMTHAQFEQAQEERRKEAASQEESRKAEDAQLRSEQQAVDQEQSDKIQESHAQEQDRKAQAQAEEQAQEEQAQEERQKGQQAEQDAKTSA